MICFPCSQESPSGGTNLGLIPALAICQTCGVALCSQHLRREDRRALCPECHGSAASPTVSDLTGVS